MKLEEIKKKYNSPDMSDEVASKISKLDNTASELVMLTKIIGIICIVDLILPDPILGLDEITLVVITSILGSVATIMNNKIQDLVVEGRAKLKLEDVEIIAKDALKAKKSKMK